MLIFLPAFDLIICFMTSPKNFEKIAILKIDSWFSSEVSKLTSVRDKLNLSLKYWFMEAKNVFCVSHGPPKWSKYHLNTIQTTLSENSYYWRALFVKINFSMPENASFWELFAEVNFYTSEGNQLSYFQNGYFLKNLWWCHEPYNRVKCR